jgi:putative oxidoreductase
MTAMRSDLPTGFPAAISRFTGALFGWVPRSLALVVARVALALPFWYSGLTKWDGFFTLSFGAKALFAEEYRLHIFGSEIPFPMPELFATLAGVGEVAFPVLLVLGIGTRYAALALIGMTLIVQLTEPDGWAIHLTWLAMELAIVTFGPGKVALDYVLGLDRRGEG